MSGDGFYGTEIQSTDRTGYEDTVCCYQLTKLPGAHYFMDMLNIDINILNIDVNILHSE